MSEQAPADEAREHLATIAKGWRHVLDPIRTERGGTRGTGIRHATEDDADQAIPPDARTDTPRTLAYWVHAALDEWPHILDRPETVPQPTTDPDTYAEWTVRIVTDTIDCTDVGAMCALLTREADRIAAWVQDGRTVGLTFVAEVAEMARVVKRVAWPPKGDRMVIGDCPACARRVRVKAPPWRRVPQPTTDPDAYPEWSWQPHRDRDVTCRCSVAGSILDWHHMLTGKSEPLTADELVVLIRERLGLTYKPLTIRTWQRRGLISLAGYAPTGHATYDPVQVLAALIDRERARDEAS